MAYKTISWVIFHFKKISNLGVKTLATKVTVHELFLPCIIARGVRPWIQRVNTNNMHCTSIINMPLYLHGTTTGTVVANI